MITLLLAAAVGAVGFNQYNQNGQIKSIRNENTAIYQKVDEHESRITNAEETLVSHRRGLDYLKSKQGAYKTSQASKKGYQAPKADWLEQLKEGSYNE